MPVARPPIPPERKPAWRPQQKSRLFFRGASAFEEFVQEIRRWWRRVGFIVAIIIPSVITGHQVQCDIAENFHSLGESHRLIRGVVFGIAKYDTLREAQGQRQARVPPVDVLNCLLYIFGGLQECGCRCIIFIAVRHVFLPSPKGAAASAFLAAMVSSISCNIGLFFAHSISLYVRH
jgi:hypothetical protein